MSMGKVSANTVSEVNRTTGDMRIIGTFNTLRSVNMTASFVDPYTNIMCLDGGK